MQRCQESTLGSRQENYPDQKTCSETRFPLEWYLQWTESSTFVEVLLFRRNNHQRDEREKTKSARQGLFCYELMSALAKKLGLKCMSLENPLHWAYGCTEMLANIVMGLFGIIAPLRKTEKNKNNYEKIQSKGKLL